MDEPVTGTIMVVDDDPVLLGFLDGILRAKGYTVRLAHTARMALTTYQATAPDLVLLDIQLPDMNGFEVCYQLKAIHPSGNLPIIFMSGLTDTAHKVKGFKVGGVDFINKPLVVEEVLVRVETHLLLSRSLLDTEEKNAELMQERERAKEALRLSKFRFRSAFEHAAHGIALVSPEGRWLKVNQALCTILGYTEAELLATDCQSITHPDDLSVSLAYFRQLLAGTLLNFHSEKRYVHKNGHTVWVLLSVAMVRDNADRPLHTVTQVLDITTRKIAETELFLTKNQLELQVGCINRIQGLFIEDSNADELFDSLLMELLKLTGSTYGFISTIRHDEQGTAHLRDLAALSTWGDGTPKQSATTDAVTRLCFRKMRDFFSAPVFRNQSLIILNHPTTDPHWCALFEEELPPLYALLGLLIKSGEKVVGILGLANRPYGYDLDLVEYLKPVLTTCAQLIKGFRNRRIRMRAEESLQRANAQLLQEVKEREQFQLQLKLQHDRLAESEARYKSLAENLNDLIYRADPQTLVATYVNRTSERLYGYTADVWTKEDLWEKTLHPDDRERVLRIFNEAQEKTENGSYEYRILHRDGTVRWVIDSFSWERNSAGEVVSLTGILHDITERKEMEQTLARSEAHFRALFESSNDAVMLLDEKGFSDCNAATLALFGCACQEEFCRLHPADISPPVQPQGEDSLSLAKARIATALAQGSNRFEWMHRRTDGHDFPTEVLLNTVVLDGKMVLLAVVRDITERKEAESKILLAKKEAEAASQAKTVFLATMSHEIRTPMNGLLGMADLILRTPLTEQQRHYVETIHRSGRTLLRIINDILDLSKIQAGQMRLELLQFDLNEVIRDIIDIFVERVKSKGLAMRCEIADLVPIHLLGDPHRLSQILFNLIGNAIKFTEEGSVSVAVEVIEEQHAYVMLCFRVIDAGIGISPEYQQQMFQAFSQEDSSVSRKFGGTGLGLAISRNLVAMMDGEIGVESAPGCGSTFWFTARFGKQQEKDRQKIATWQAQQHPPTPENVRFEGQVLLVEDNQVNQEVAMATLEMFGCHVAVAENGQRAIALLHKTDPPFDAVFMDCEMPILDGFEATRRLRQWENETGHPRTPVIALTAHVLEQSRQQCREAGMDDYLRKPFSQADLGAILYRWMPKRLVANHKNKDIFPASPLCSSTQPPLEAEHKNGEPHAAPVLDQTALSRIFELTRKGNKSLFNKMVDSYLMRTPELLNALQQAIEQNDQEGVRVAAHTLKSSSLTMGAIRLAEMGRAMEENYTDLARVRYHLQSSGSTFDEVRQALSALCHAQQPGDLHE